jgi:hypothetical protein
LDELKSIGGGELEDGIEEGVHGGGAIGG